MDTGELNAEGSPALDWHPIQDGGEYSLHATETKISYGLVSRLYLVPFTRGPEGSTIGIGN